MESFQIDGLRVFNPVKGSFMLVKSKTGSEDSEAEAGADTTTITSADGSKIVRSRHHGDSEDFPIAVVPALAIVCTFIWLIVKAVMAPFSPRAQRRNNTPTGSPAGLSDEEQAVLVKLQRTLTDMEQRIESLETILINDHRTKENYGTKI